MKKVKYFDRARNAVGLLFVSLILVYRFSESYSAEASIRMLLVLFGVLTVAGLVVVTRTLIVGRERNRKYSTCRFISLLTVLTGASVFAVREMILLAKDRIELRGTGYKTENVIVVSASSSLFGYWLSQNVEVRNITTGLDIKNLSLYFGRHAFKPDESYSIVVAPRSKLIVRESRSD